MEYYTFSYFRDKKSSIDEKFYSKEFNRNNAFRLSAFQLNLYFRANLMCLYVAPSRTQFKISKFGVLEGLRDLNFLF